MKLILVIVLILVLVVLLPRCFHDESELWRIYKGTSSTAGTGFMR